MSRVVIPPITSKAVLFEEVDRRIDHVVSVLNGALDRDNLDKTYRLPVAGFAEPNAPVVLTAHIMPDAYYGFLGVPPGVNIYPVCATVATRWSAPVPGYVYLFYGATPAPITFCSIYVGDLQMASGTSANRTLAARTSTFVWSALGGGHLVQDTPIWAVWSAIGGGAFAGGPPDGPTTVTLYGKIQHRS